MKVSVLLLEGVLVMEEDVAVQILKASGLAETQELEVNETILNGVSCATPSKGEPGGRKISHVLIVQKYSKVKKYGYFR